MPSDSRLVNRCRCCNAEIPAKSEPAFGLKRRAPLEYCFACSHLRCATIRRRIGRPHSQCPGNTRFPKIQVSGFEEIVSAA